jgi:hypothetical protein
MDGGGGLCGEETVAVVVDMTSANILVEKPEGKRTLGRPKRRRGNHIEMDLETCGFGVVDWTYMAQRKTDGGLLCTTAINLVHKGREFNSPSV